MFLGPGQTQPNHGSAMYGFPSESMLCFNNENFYLSNGRKMYLSNSLFRSKIFYFKMAAMFLYNFHEIFNVKTSDNTLLSA